MSEQIAKSDGYTRGTWEAVTGNRPELMSEGERAYFPHVRVPVTASARPYLKDPSEKITVNFCMGMMDEHDANAELLGAASRMRESLVTVIQAAKGRIAKIEADSRYKDYVKNGAATIDINAPLALIQLGMNTEREVLREVLVAVGETVKP